MHAIMAAYKKTFPTEISVTPVRKIMKPVISTDVMGNRNVEVKAVGARAEPALIYTEIRVPDAVRAAQEQEVKIRELQEQKEARLRQFQEDVKKRVRQVSRTKHQQQLKKDYEAMEKQHQMVRLCEKSSDVLTERKDRVVHDLASQPPARCVSITIGGEPDVQKKVFDKHNKQVHTFTKQARQKLSGKKVEPDLEDLEEVLPSSGVSSPALMNKMESADTLYSRTRSPGSSRDYEYDRFKLQDEEANRYYTLPPQQQRSQDFDAEKENEEWEEGERLRPRKGKKEEDEEERRAREQRVKFNTRTIEYSPPHTERKNRKKGSRSKGKNSSAAPVPDLMSGVAEISERRRQEQQKLTYRRLYSDLERQAVRDNDRRKKQTEQIRQIKKEKEEQRKKEEDSARRLTEARDPVTGETSLESSLRHQLEKSHLEEVMHQREEQRQRQREMTRYLEALRSSLQEKLSKQRRDLPALCCCGDTLWDTHPDTCANNCFYYKNHRAYARALQSLLNCSEVM